MTILKHLLSIILITAIFLPARAQTESTQQTDLVERLNKRVNNSPSELAYIQTNKDIYETGEDLWFKVYLLNAQYLIPSVLSKTLYLQLFKEDTKKVIWQEKYEILDGIADGQVYLDSKLSEGDYLIAAFTSNSFFDDTSEFKAIRRIKIIQDVNSSPLLVSKSTAPVSFSRIQFTALPEGGNLVSGIPGKVAFKAVNIKGEPEEVQGTLFEDSSSILEFKSMHAGMGSFNFIPNAGKKYVIKLKEPAVDTSYFLPEILLSGITIILTGRDKEALTLRVSQSQDLPAQDLYLRVQCRGEVYGITSCRLENELRIKIPLSGLPQGPAEITLFNSSLVPVAERLIYINLDKKLNITTELSKEIYQTRGKATLKISVKDENGLPVIANLGVTVFDKMYQNTLDSNNILTYYYLSTQLKGRIFNPSYYFNKGKHQEEALDLLMLTQGWRKYVWNDLNPEKIQETNQQIIFDGINGELYYQNQRNKIPKEQTFVMAFSPNKDSSKVLIPADSTGAFFVSEGRLKTWENDYVYLKPFGSYGSQPIYKITSPEVPEYNLHIKLIDPFETISYVMNSKEAIYPLESPVIKKENSQTVTFDNKVIEIPEVTIHGQKEKRIRGKFMGTLDSLIKYDLYMDYVCEYGVLNCPRHKRDEFGTTKPIPGHYYYRIIAYGSPGEHTIPVMYQPPNFREEEILKMSNISRVKAYYGHREFYKPNYDKKTEADIIPDYRNTLLWEPSVITDKKGEAVLSFFCSDINSEFVGRIEGASDKGLLGTGNFKFVVRQLNIPH